MMRRSASLLTTAMAFACVYLCTGCAGPYKPPGERLPDGFAINIYPGSVCTKSDSTPLPEHKVQQVVVLLSNDNTYKVKSWYSTELVLKGYQVLSDNDIKGSITLECQNDKNHVSVTMSPIADKTIISISVFPRAK